MNNNRTFGIVYVSVIKKTLLLILPLFILVFLAFFPIVSADRGGFSPIGERVSESGQKAIIAWNGTHEVLTLSTDVSSSNESEVVEIMPLPSNPTISKGEKQSFLKVTELVNTYLAVTSPKKLRFSLSRVRDWSWEQSTPKITIMFQEAIGVHYLTVVKAEEAGDLIQWLENFLETKGYTKELPSNLEELFSYYIQNKMNFFVIDMIETNSTVKTVDPLVYEFRSSKLYYPLRISTLFSGDTDISLFTITNNELNDDSILTEGFDKKAQFQIKQEVLAEISSNFTKLFSSNPYICYFQFNGALESFDGDVSAGFQPNIPMIMVATLSLGSGLTVLLLLFPVNKIGLRLKNIDLPVNRRLEMASLLTGLVGVFLTLGGFFLPWGLLGFGKGEEVLIALNGSYETSLLVGENVIFPMDFYLAALIPYVYLLLVKRNSKGAIGVVAAGGVYIMLQTIMWMRNVFPIPNVFYVYYPAHIINIGVYTTLIGSSFIILSGLLSFWRLGNLGKQ